MKSPLSAKKEFLTEQFNLFHASTPIGIRPNFSSLARQTGLNRHTVARAYERYLNGSVEQNKTRQLRKGNP